MIVFRADLSQQTGLRSLSRCAYLAALLRRTCPVLVCSREEKRAAKYLAERKVPFSLVKDPAAIEIAGARAIVFDLVPFSAQDIALLARARKAGIQTVQLVPAGEEPQAADLSVSPASGAENALLHHKFRHFNRAKRKYRGKVGRLYIDLGDLLPYRDLRAVIDVLHRLRFRMKIAPGLNLKKADRRNLMRIYPGIHFRGKSESPARAYFEADLALVPPGDEALEAACAGTPALYLPLDKRQENMADAWAGRGIGAKFPSLAALSVQSARAAIEPLTLERREAMGAAGRKLVDGLGVQRFFKVLKENGIIE